MNDQSIRMILGEMTRQELSRIAVDIIRENRRKLDQAQSLFDMLERHGFDNPEDFCTSDLRHNYRLALLELRTHHELARLVVEALGHVPRTVPDTDQH